MIAIIGYVHRCYQLDTNISLPSITGKSITYSQSLMSVASTLLHSGVCLNETTPRDPNVLTVLDEAAVALKANVAKVPGNFNRDNTKY